MVNTIKTKYQIYFNTAGNCLTNQHSTIKEVHDILNDENLCECIVEILM
ncbi:hypothetical protein ACH1X1_001113 [Campylobacter jejuni]